MIYKMELSDSFDTMIFPLLEVPIEDKDVSGIASNTTIDGNVFNDYLWLKKQYVQKWSIMCQDEYNRLRGFWTRQFGNAEVPFYRLFYGDNVYEDRNTFTVNGFVQIENDAPLYSPLSLTHLYGNTTQETLSGVNMYDVFDTDGGTLQNITVDADGWATCTINNTGGTGYAYGFLWTNNLVALQTNTTYAIVMEVKAKSGTGIIDPTQGSSANSQMTANVHYDFANISAGQTYIFTQKTKASFAGTTQGLRTVVSFNAGQSGSITFRLSVLADTSITPQTFTYQPFTGNVPSPNPDYPQSVQTMTGEQTVKITGKNLLDASTMGWGWVNSSGAIISNYQNALSDYINCEPGTTYMASIGTPQTGSTQINFAFYDTDKTIISRFVNSPNTTARSATTPDGCHYIRVWFYRSPDWTAEDAASANFMLEKSESATTYEPYQGQSYTIDLDTLELCKIGTYQDYIYKDGGKWYKHAEVGKAIWDGSEAWTTASNYCYHTESDAYVPASRDVVADILCDNFTPTSYLLATGTTLDYAIALDSNNVGRFALRHKDYLSASTLKTWLSTHNTTVYYILATPTDTEITDSELIEQLNHIYSLYGGVNNLMLIPSGGAQGEIGMKYRLNYEQETDIVPKTPVVLTLTDGGVINACGCRQNIQLIMRETKESTES